MPIGKEIRYGRVFGFGDVWSHSGLAKDDLSKMTRSDRLLAVGFSHACPDVNNVAKEYGYEWTMKRYLECNWIYQNIALNNSKEKNLELHKKLSSSVLRQPNELPDYNLDRNLIPLSFEIEMSPLSTSWGYAIPRLILVGARDEKNIGSKEKVKEVKKIVNKLISKHISPIEFTVDLATEVFKHGANPLKIFDHLLSAPILREEGCKTMYRQTFKAMEKYAPELLSAYNSYLRDEGEIGLHEIGVIAPSDLK